MKSVIAAILLAGLTSTIIVGCSEKSKSSVKEETKIDGPGGTTTITSEKEVKTTGKNPPAATP